MQKKNPCILAALTLFLALTPAFAADLAPIAPAANCSQELTAATSWQQRSFCPQSFCTDDDYCQSLCPSNPGSYCNLFTSTCVYPTGGGPGGGGCQSGALCTPGRFCNDQSDCASCTGGCPGYCAADGICRLI